MQATTSSQLLIQYPNILIGFAIYGVISFIATIFLIGRWTNRTKKPKQIK